MLVAVETRVRLRHSDNYIRTGDIKVTQKNLSISTATITISVVKVDGHKMTKSTFRQIQRKELKEWPKKEDILGWVRDDGCRYVLFTENGKLVKADVGTWGHTNTEGVRVSATERIEQLFIAT